MCSRIFMVFKSLIHFPFIRAYGVRTGSSFIFLHVSVQFSHLLTIYWLLSSPPVCSCLLCQILIVGKGAGLFLSCPFYLVNLCVYFFFSWKGFYCLCSTVGISHYLLFPGLLGGVGPREGLLVGDPVQYFMVEKGLVWKRGVWLCLNFSELHCPGWALVSSLGPWEGPGEV